MRRRHYLRAAGLSLVVLAGCTGELPGGGNRGREGSDSTDRRPSETTERERTTDNGEPTTTADHDEPTTTTVGSPEAVSATYRFSNPWTGSRTLEVDPDGTVTQAANLYCREDGEQVHIETAHESEFDDETMAQLRRLATEADPEAWKDYYECEGSCPTDMPSVRITLGIGGERYHSGYYGGRVEPLPEGLAAIDEFLGARLPGENEFCE